MNSFIVIILSVGITQGLFLLISIPFIKNKRTIPLRILWALLCCFLILLIPEWLYSYYSIERLATIYRMGETIPLLIGPLYWLYTNSLIRINFRLLNRDLVHFIPFIIAVFVFIPFYLQSNDFKIEYIQWRQRNPIPYSIALFTWLKGVHTLIYLIFCYVALKVEKGKRDEKSRIDSAWLNILLLLQIPLSLVVYGVFTWQYLSGMIQLTPILLLLYLSYLPYTLILS